MGTLRGFAVGVLFAWAPASSHPPPWLAPMLEPVAGPPAPASFHAIHSRPSPAKPKPRRRLAPRLVAVRAALRQLGVPYRWGGTTRRGFDCSGLVQYAYAKAGIRLPRTTYGQIRVGRRVANIHRARRGDILFPSRGHEQLYLGDGRVVEAARTGTRVRIRPVRGYYLAIRRPVPAH